MKKTAAILCFLFLSTSLFAQRTNLIHWEFRLAKDSVTTKIQLPHTWNKLDALDDTRGYYQGEGIYTTALTIPDTTQRYYLHFAGANQTTSVWFNGQFVGTHRGGYTAFQFDVSDMVTKGFNKVKVVVNNTLDQTIPPLNADFTFYGGLYRAVRLQQENPVHFKKSNGADLVKIDPVLDEQLNGTVSVEALLNNPTDKAYSVKLALYSPDYKVFYTQTKNATDFFKHQIKLDAPRRWSPDRPQLYRCQMQILDENGIVLDQYSHTFGFRKISATVDGFFLNNEPLKLVGANRHQDWEGYGNAVPVELQLKDLVAIKNMGSNFLRLAHYPQDKRIYEKADSLGLILWSEIPIVNKVPIGVDYGEFEKNSLQMQREHIAQMYNHPSVVFIGYMNEIFLRMVFDKPTPEDRQAIIDNSVQLAQKLEDLTRQEAPHHITVMALHCDKIYNETKITDLPMVIGWNLYYGWYSGATNDLGGFLDSENKRFPDRPLILSEYGVGADQRLHNPDPKKFDFSEEYQLDYHQGYWKQVWERDYMIGMTAWNFADFGSEFRGDAMPHVNQKGLVNFDRTPKNIYYWYQAVMKPAEPMMRIYRSLSAHIHVSNKKEIILIANRKTTLLVNDSLQYTADPTNGIIRQTILLNPGKNNLKIFDENKKLHDEIDLQYQRPVIKKSGDILALNFGTSNTFIDSAQQIWIPAENVNKEVITGTLKSRKTSTNIRNTGNDPLFQSMLTGITKLEFRVPDGAYRVQLLWSNFGAAKKLAYELTKEAEAEKKERVSNIILLNGEQVAVPTIKEFYFAESSFDLKSKNGKIILTGNKNQPFNLSGIRIEKK